MDSNSSAYAGNVGETVFAVVETAGCKVVEVAVESRDESALAVLTGRLCAEIAPHVGRIGHVLITPNGDGLRAQALIWAGEEVVSA